MEDMDFTQPQAPVEPSAPFKTANSQFYDYKMAGRIFEAAGRTERFTAGQVLFAEDQKAAGGLFKRAASRMYFLAEGEVALTIGGRPLDTVQQGEVFGEMAVISNRPRSATATAKTDGSAFSLGAEELQAALGKSPEFALMLMSVMFDRLRFIAARLTVRKSAIAARTQQEPAFDAALLARLEATLARAATSRFAQGTMIMKEGQTGAFLYVVKSGRVAIGIGGRLVELVGPGGTFGEMGVVDQSPRAASAQADTECELLAIDRPSLLDAVAKQPAFAMAILHAVAERLRHMNSQLG